MDTTASITKTAVWDRNDILGVNVTGKVDSDYLDALFAAEDAATSDDIRQKCRDRIYQHVRVTLD